MIFVTPCPCKAAFLPSVNCSRIPRADLLYGNRGGRFHCDDKTLTARRWASRAWICCLLVLQGPAPPGMGQGLHRIVLSRRGDRVRGRAPAVFRMPAQGRGRLCAAMAGPAQAQRSRSRRGNGRDPAGRAARRPREAARIAWPLDDLPDGACHRHAGRTKGRPRCCAGASCCAGRRKATSSQAGVRAASSRGADAAIDPRRAQGRISAALASQRRCNCLSMIFSENRFPLFGIML